jgi:two-component system cell cycle response regulator
MKAQLAVSRIRNCSTILSQSSIRVLLIEDSSSDALLMREAFAAAGSFHFATIHVERLSEGLRLLAQEQFDVILLDLGLPDSQGIETLRKLQRQAWHVPVIVMTSLDDEAIGIQALREGAQDYLVKGHVDSYGLARATRHSLERHRLFIDQCNLSFADELTGLYNRRGFVCLGEQQIRLARRGRKGLMFAYGDLDGLKSINDTFGHLEGDRALIKVAEVLRSTFRHSDVLGRIGGDEFAILAIHNRLNTAPICKRLQTELENKSLSGAYKLSMSLGILHFQPSARLSIEEMMAKSDEAMYAQKRASLRL